MLFNTALAGSPLWAPPHTPHPTVFPTPQPHPLVLLCVHTLIILNSFHFDFCEDAGADEGKKENEPGFDRIIHSRDSLPQWQ